MNNLKQDLRTAITQWRKLAEKSATAANEVPNRFAQGHLTGMSTAFDNAAKRLEAILLKNAPALRNSKATIRHKVAHLVRKPSPLHPPLK